MLINIILDMQHIAQFSRIKKIEVVALVQRQFLNLDGTLGRNGE
jgi:hypothetical protein